MKSAIVAPAVLEFFLRAAENHRMEGSTARQQPESRLRYVDGLRAVAVLSVVAHHAVKYSGATGGWTSRILMQGHHGVELFFVISGFCLAYPTLIRLYDRGTTTLDILGYSARRLTRILPPFYAAIALFGLMGPHKVPITDVMRQALFIDNGTQLLNSSFWSLAVEFRWYFLFPLLLLLWVKAPRPFACVIVALFVLQETRAVSTDLVALPAFMLGIAAAHIAIHRPAQARFALPLFCAALIAAFLNTSTSDIGQETSVLWELAVFLLVVSAAGTRWLNRALSIAPLVFIGIVSYSIYLCHELGVYYAERLGYAPWIAGLAGVVLGIVFWFAAERPFTHTSVRTRLISAVEALLPRCFTFAGIPVSMQLAVKGVPGGAPVPPLPQEERVYLAGT
jgi:peptidoglycan/LPS O-acetylase OafA/YrhL